MKTKFLLPIAILFFTATTANAQINEGRYLLGGSIGYNSQKNSLSPGNKDESFSSNIQFGKVIKDNTVAGIIASYGFSDDGQGDKLNQFSAGVFYRKYKTITKNFYFFGQVAASYELSNGTTGFYPDSVGSRDISNGGTLSFTPGISYSVCKRMQIELLMQNIASISYAGTKYETKSSATSSISTQKVSDFSGGVSLDSNLLSNFGIGFKFFLGK